MDKKNYVAMNQRNHNNYALMNYKSSSQRINNAYDKQILNNNYDKISKSIGNINQNNIINLSKMDKSSGGDKKQNLDENSLDNISNIIDSSQKKLTYNQLKFEDTKSSLIDNNCQNKSNTICGITNDSNNNNIFINDNLKIYDSHTRSFQMKMKKMKEMNKMIIKENKTMNDSYKSENTYKSSNLNDYKSIINCKQKLISMKNKNKLLGNINDFNNFNIHLNDINNNNNNSSKNNEINQNKKMGSFFCCYGGTSQIN